MAAMFQAQTANWEETQEKMTQLVSRFRGFFVLCSRLVSHERDLFFPPHCYYVGLNSAVRIYNNPRGTSFTRGKPHALSHQQHHQQQPDRPLPPNYVCYRCGQKGSLSSYHFEQIHLKNLQGHWIHDCPTNNDREFDNRPRIKRTTGIPRSMLKAVDNPNGDSLGQGVMVTPEGGYVVAQPDLCVYFCIKVYCSQLTDIYLGYHGRSKFCDPRD